MELGMFTSGYQYYPLERAFAAPDLARGELSGVLALIERHEMPVRVYTPEHNAYPYNYMLGSELQRADALDYLKLCLNMGKALGADHTLISTGHGGYTASRRELRSRLVRCLRELADHAESIGHTILLEALTPYETNVCTTAGELSETLETVDSPALMGMCDVVPPWVIREPITNYLDQLGGRMAHLHLVDGDGNSDSHLIPGDGCIPLPELLEDLSSTITETALCGLGQSACKPVQSTLKYFRDEYLAHVVEKHCPHCNGRKKELHIDPELCKGCGKCMRQCPMEAISGQIRMPHVIDTEKCIKCGACWGCCPFGAIREE